MNQELGKPKKQKRYFEKKKGGGFRLYPMQFDPQKTEPCLWHGFLRWLGDEDSNPG